MTAPSETNVVSFYPIFFSLSDPERDKKIEEYRAWLDQYGRYGKLYMMDIGKISIIPGTIIKGVKIYDSEIAILFRLTFEI